MSSAAAMNMATMVVVVDTVDTLRRVIGAAWEWVTLRMELLGSGSGSGRLLFSKTSSLTPTAVDSRTLLPALPNTEGDTTAAAAMMTCRSVVVPVVLPIEDLADTTGMDRFGGAVRGLGMGMSNGGGAPGSALCVGGFEFDDASPQFPAASDILRGDFLYGLPSAGRGNGTIGSGAGGGPSGPRSAAGNSSGVDELPGLFSSFRVGGGAGDASRAPGAAAAAAATATGGAGAYASRYT
jgi:hypothetical protein